jgi:indole-3-glycerol phosphate synthase
MDFLTKIVERKRLRLEEAKTETPLVQVRNLAVRLREAATPHALTKALQQSQGVNIIAEFKRRSPSKGEIRPGADPAVMARAYQTGGATALSILTEEDHFDGSLDDLRIARQAASLPILRKDFIFDEYQVFESAAAGAEALLLIVASLDDDLLGRLRRLAEDELGLDALVEVHNRTELERAIGCGCRLIGVNNRDLRTFEVSLETSIQLASAVPSEVLLISESGINSVSDIQRLARVGYRGFLIGETLMRADDARELLAQFSAKENVATEALRKSGQK